MEGLFAEVSPHKVRAVAGTFSKLAYCVTNFLFVFVYPPVNAYVGTFAYLAHVVPSCGCLLYFAYNLPETGKKSVADVADEIELTKSGKKQLEGTSTCVSLSTTPSSADNDKGK